MEDLSLTRVIYDGKVEYGMWYEVCFSKESRPLKTASRRAPRNGCFLFTSRDHVNYFLKTSLLFLNVSVKK